MRVKAGKALPLAIVLAYLMIPVSVRRHFGGRPTAARTLRSIREGRGWGALIQGITDWPSPRQWD
jgi:hypothetical protein